MQYNQQNIFKNIRSSEYLWIVESTILFAEHAYKFIEFETFKLIMQKMKMF